MLKVLKKIYPVPKDNNYDLLNYDNEGLWSISYPDLADILSKHLKVFDNRVSSITLQVSILIAIHFCKTLAIQS